jgi:ribosomal peptide maturation radical SAM protein 1
VLLREAPGIVGFTSMFQQHNASLALARRLKRASPSTFVVFGGANCEGVMGAETVRSFPFVDAALSGEGDLVFPQLVRRILDRSTLSGLPGVRCRTDVDLEFRRGSFPGCPVVRDMDRLPVPDYSDYFEQFQAGRFDREWSPSILVETSRGCWWGKRSQCTFCGLHPSTLAFRSKSPARAVAEITELAGRHPRCQVQAVDNILDFRWFSRTGPALASRRRRPRLFYETKSNLKKDQVRLLRRAGVLDIQPGIESFSDAVLKIMRKGVTGLQNIQLLKWCRELGVQPSWNFLWGFPGEPPHEYERLARLVPLLSHLPPPVAQATIRLDRFSPNFEDSERLGLTGVEPFPAYRHVYALPEPGPTNLARYFTFGYAEPRDVDRYTARLERELRRWRRAAETSVLLSIDTGEHLVLVDLRPVSRRPLVVLGGLSRRLYRECDAVRTLAQLARAAATSDRPVAAEAIDRTLAPLLKLGVLLRDGSRYLALAIPLGEYGLPAGAHRRFAAMVERLGTPDGDRWVVPMDAACSGRPAATRKGRVPRLDAARFSVGSGGELVIERRHDPTR